MDGSQFGGVGGDKPAQDQRGLRAVNRPAHDPVDPALRRWLDAPPAAAIEQLIANDLVARVCLGDVLGQPRLKPARVLDRALAKAEVRADLRTVIAIRPLRELIAPQRVGRHLDLSGDELDHSRACPRPALDRRRAASNARPAHQGQADRHSAEVPSSIRNGTNASV